MTFSEFARYLARLEAVSARLDMTAILAELFQALEPAEIQPACYLLQGRLVAYHQSLEFNVSTKLLQRVLAKVKAAGQPTTQATNLFGETVAAEYDQIVADLYAKHGDLGLVAEEVAAETTASQLSLVSVFDRLLAVAEEAGAGSQDRKIIGLTELLLELDATSAKFVARIVIGKLRLGFSTMTMIDALSWAVTGDKSERTELEAAFNKQADIGLLASQYLAWKSHSPEQRRQQLAAIAVQVGVPVMPALCQRLNTSQEIIDKLGVVIAEPKYDGMRVQIHIDKTADQPVRVYTRSLDEVTHMFPEAAGPALAAIDAQSAVLDGEVIGYDPATDQLRPFQDTITRRRKHDVASAAEAIPVRFYLFDVMFLNDQSVISEKMQIRKNLLTKIINDNEVYLETPYIVTDQPETLRQYHTELLAQNLEGAVIKKVDAPYTSGRKGWAWVKIKEAEGTSGKLSDTLDLVVMGYYSGRGKRAAFGLGALLLGTPDTSDDTQETQFKTVAKLGTGMTEDLLRELKAACDAVSVSTPPETYQVPKELKPDVWCQPKIVVEVAADELTNSPLHTAQVALRFPRLLMVRTDKTPDQATSLAEIKQLQAAG